MKKLTKNRYNISFIRTPKIKFLFVFGFGVESSLAVSELLHGCPKMFIQRCLNPYVSNKTDGTSYHLISWRLEMVSNKDMIIDDKINEET